MECQDWNPIVFGKKPQQKKNDKKESKEKQEQDTKIIAPKNLGQEFAKARNSKGMNQQQFANAIGVSKIVLCRWENNKEYPTNNQIANMEKHLGIKLPRVQKKKVDAH